MYFFFIQICLIGTVVGPLLEVSEWNITKLCLSDVINRLFSNSTLLNILTDNSDTCNGDMINLEMTPRTVLKIGEEFKQENVSLSGNQFLICSNNVSHIEEKLLIGRAKGKGNGKGRGKGKGRGRGRGRSQIMGNGIYLIVVGEGDVSKIFHMFWEFGVINVSVLAYDNETATLHTSNPFDEKNQCGNFTKNIVPHSCESQWVLPNKKLLNLNGCPIKFKVTSEEDPWSSSKYILKILHHLAQYYNGSLDIDSQTSGGRSNGTNIIISITEAPNSTYRDVTMALISDPIVWLVPKALPLSSVSAVRHTFRNDVWCLIFAIFVITSIAWWCVISYKTGHFTFVGKLTTAIIIVFSLTFSGTIRNTPKQFMLRCILFTYSIYIIHINCAFTSNYFNILTNTRYDFQISNLGELAESNFSIYIEQSFKNKQFSRNDTNIKLYAKLQDLLIPCTAEQYIEAFDILTNYRNCAVITIREFLSTIYSSELYNNATEIEDSSITGALETRLALRKNHYFTEFLNRFLEKMVESGIGDKELEWTKSETQVRFDIAEDDEKVGISLIHLSFAFFFLGIGLLVSLLVFFMELIMHRHFN